MNIALFTDSFEANEHYGNYNSISLLKQFLEENGHNVFIFAPGKKSLSNEHVFYFSSASFKEIPDLEIPFVLNSSIQNIVKKLNIDIIHIIGVGLMAYNGKEIGKKLSIPTVLTIPKLLHKLTASILPYGKRTMEKLAIKYLKELSKDVIVTTPSHYAYKELSSIGINITKIIPFGIDTQFFINNEKTKKRKEIVTAGRILKNKNIDKIIEVLPSLINKVKLKLHICGNGAYLQSLKDLCLKLKVCDAIKFHGFIDKEKIRDIYKRTSIYLSLSNIDVQSISAIEALASQNVLIANKDNALAEIINEYNVGYVISDTKDLLTKVEEAFNNKKELTEKVMEVVKLFDYKHVYKQYLNLYEELNR